MIHYDDETIKRLESMATTIRKHIIKMTCSAGSGHPGGSLSITDVLVALYFQILRHDPKNPKWSDRDRCVLSKGHAAPALYAVLAEAGYFPVEILPTLRKIGSILQGHPDMKKVPGVEISTGSLGQGLSAGVGMALGGKLDNKEYHVFVIIGDGESNEGQIWEAAMSAAHYKLDNLTVILDRNGLQIDGATEQIMSLEPIVEKWLAFGWHVLKINGHSMREILDALDEKNIVKGRPTVVIAKTIKGKCVSFMEGSLDFHGKAPTKEQAEKALAELGGG
jgi:transketolase